MIKPHNQTKKIETDSQILNTNSIQTEWEI